VKDPRTDPILPVGLPPAVGVVQESWRLVGQARVVGPALTGAQQRVRSPAQRWAASMTLEARFDQLTAWRAWLARHEGGMTPALLGPLLGRFPTVGMAGSVWFFTDATGYDDGTGLTDGGGRIVTVGVAAAASTALRVAGAGVGDEGRVGEFLSIRSRMHVVRTFAASGSGAADLEVWPPLSAEVPAGTRLDYRPASRVRIVDPDAGESPVPGRVARVRWSIDVLEDQVSGPLSKPLRAMDRVWK